MTNDTRGERLLIPAVGVVLVGQALLTLAGLPRLLQYYPDPVAPLAGFAAVVLLLLGVGLLAIGARTDDGRATADLLPT